MKYYPIMLNIENKQCIVVGGGAVAERKVQSLIEYGAEVTVISPGITEGLRAMVDQHKIRWTDRSYQRGDLRDGYLIYVATNDPKVNQSCRWEAEEFNLMINVVDVPELCDFIVPAVHRQGSLTLTVSTDGKSPMLSRRIKEDLKKQYGPRYNQLLDILGEIRKRALVEIKDINCRKQLFHSLIYNTGDEYISQQDLIERMWLRYEAFKQREEGFRNEKDQNRL